MGIKRGYGTCIKCVRNNNNNFITCLRLTKIQQVYNSNMVNYITSSKFTICMFDYTNLCEVNFKTRRTTYCSNIVLYSMNMFYTLYSIYNMYVQFILIFTNFKNEEKYLYILQSSSPRYKRLFVSLSTRPYSLAEILSS